MPERSVSMCFISLCAYVPSIVDRHIFCLALCFFVAASQQNSSPSKYPFFLVEIFLESLLWILSSGQLKFDLLLTKSVSQISIQSSVANIFKTSAYL